MSRIIEWNVGVERFKELIELLDNGHVVDYGILFEDSITLDNGDMIFVSGVVPDVPDRRNDFGYVQFDYESTKGTNRNNPELYGEDIFNGALIPLIDAYGDEFKLKIIVG